MSRKAARCDAATVRRLLKTGPVRIEVDARVPGVALPKRLLGRDVVLAWSKHDPLDCRVLADAITATFTFCRRSPWSRWLGRRKRVGFACVIPWAAVTSVARYKPPAQRRCNARKQRERRWVEAYRQRRAAERERRHAAYDAERAAAGLKPDQWSSVDEQHAWQRLSDVERMRAGTYVDEPGQRVHSIGTHSWLVSDPPMHGPVSADAREASQRAYDDTLAQVGMRRDADGRYYTSRPKP